MTKTRWTPELLDQVRHRAEAGLTMREAALALGVKLDVLATKASHHAIRFHGKRRPQRAADRQAMRDAAMAARLREIERARAEAAQAPGYKPGRLVW